MIRKLNNKQVANFWNKQLKATYNKQVNLIKFSKQI